MLLAHRQKQLKYWCEHFKLQQTIKTGYPDLLSTAWLAGFIDAEGCFSILSCKDRRYKSGFRVRYRFCLDQKEGLPLFKHIKATLQSGWIYHRKETEVVCRYETTSKGSHRNLLLPYLNRFPCLTKKHVLVFKWYKDLVLNNKKKVEDKVQPTTKVAGRCN